MALSDRDRAILDFERSWWTEEGAKETAIRTRFQLSPGRYYQVLGALLSCPRPPPTTRCWSGDCGGSGSTEDGPASRDGRPSAGPRDAGPGTQ